MHQLAVFSDLDGTLLDHETYSWAPAEPALKALKAHSVPLILASSKTAAEIGPLREELGFSGVPAIVENGAGVLPPHESADADQSRYFSLREALEQVSPTLRAHFRGFGDMTAAGVSEVTGLTLEAAELAATRQFSEPGVWTGTEEERDAFVAELQSLGVQSRHGGRFLTFSFGGDKADRVAEISQALGATETLALGDAPNDIGMISATSYGVIIKNDGGHGIDPLPGEATGQISRTSLSGPEGWNVAVLEFLGRHNLAIYEEPTLG